MNYIDLAVMLREFPSVTKPRNRVDIDRAVAPVIIAFCAQR